MKYSVFAPDEVDSVEAELCRLWRENLPISDDELRQRVRWYYQGNPSGHGAVRLLRAEHDDTTEIVGCSGVGPRRFVVSGRVTQVGLLADFAVSKSHRTLQPALVLKRAMMEHCRKTYPFAYGFPNHRAEGLVKRLGYTSLGQMARYACVLRHATHLGSLVSRPLVVRTLSAGIDWALQGVRTISASAGPDQVEIVEEPNVTDEFDGLWDRGRNQYGVCCVRSREYLEWRFRFGRQPERLLLGLRDRAARTLHGYMFVQPDGNVAHINDFFADTDAHLERMFVGVLAEMYRRRMHSASLRFLGATRVRSMLSRVGFTLRDASRALYVDVSESAAHLVPFVTNKENWFATDGDEDA
jgi:hypothetical protein